VYTAKQESVVLYSRRSCNNSVLLRYSPACVYCKRKFYPILPVVSRSHPAFR